MFNLHTRQRLTLRERPLIVMKVQGDLVLLWPNNNLASALDHGLYLRLLGALAA